MNLMHNKIVTTKLSGDFLNAYLQYQPPYLPEGRVHESIRSENNRQPLLQHEAAEHLLLYI